MNRRLIERRREEIEGCREAIGRLLFENLLPFWADRIQDKRDGGFFSCFNRRGERYADVKPGWFVGRNIYTYANLYRSFARRKAGCALRKV